MDDGFDKSLFSYLGDCKSELHGYLGHFANMKHLCRGHNDLPMETAIESGQIPDIHSQVGTETSITGGLR